MKIKIRDIKGNKKVNRVEYINSALIIDNRVYKKRRNKEIYNYLEAKDFRYYLEPIRTKKGIDEFAFLKETKIDNNDKALDLMYILAYLQNKTTSYEDINLDKVKEKFESINERIISLRNYYYQLQDKIERKVYFNPSEYLLMINISLIYEALNQAKTTIDKYYELVTKKAKIRKVFIHGKLELNHFFDNEDKKLISFNNLEKDLPIYDFIYFYKTHYRDADMIDLFNAYQNKFLYSEEELMLLFSEILVTNKVEIRDNSYLVYEKVQNLIEYVQITKNFVLKQNEKYKEYKEKKLQE
ncbi:MAG: hypothetical protein IJH18_01915 [Bacilli bacterium]|nr:hypothetical protein [Bacilli bacterium]